MARLERSLACSETDEGPRSSQVEGCNCAARPFATSLGFDRVSDCTFRCGWWRRNRTGGTGARRIMACPSFRERGAEGALGEVLQSHGLRAANVEGSCVLRQSAPVPPNAPHREGQGQLSGARQVAISRRAHAHCAPELSRLDAARAPYLSEALTCGVGARMVRREVGTMRESDAALLVGGSSHRDGCCELCVRLCRSEPKCAQASSDSGVQHGDRRRHLGSSVTLGLCARARGVDIDSVFDFPSPALGYPRICLETVVRHRIVAAD